MKAVIESAKYVQEFMSKYGTLYSHKIGYDGKFAFYSSKSKEQKKFVPGQESEFMEIQKTGKKGPYLTIKPATTFQGANSNTPLGKSVHREQGRYSGFAMSYSKDLVVAGKITEDKLYSEAEKMFYFMVDLDKKLLGND